MLQRHALILLAGALLLSGCQAIYDDTKGWASRLEAAILDTAEDNSGDEAEPNPSPEAPAAETAPGPQSVVQNAAMTRLPRPDGMPHPILIDPADKRPEDRLLLDSLPSPTEPAPLKEAAAEGGTAEEPAALENAAGVAAPPPLPQPKPAREAAQEDKKGGAELATEHAMVLHLSSLRSEAAAKREWSDLQQRYPEALGTMQGQFRRTELGDRGTFYRVLAGPLPSKSAAEEACAALKAKDAKQYCRVMPPKPKS